MLYQRIKKEYDRLQSAILHVQEKMSKLPEGTLIVARNGKKYYKWYVVDETGKKFIPQNEHQSVQKLAYKKYLSIQLKNMSQELRAIEFYLKHHDEYAYQKEQELLENPEFQKLIDEIYKPTNQQFQEWMNAPYKRNESHPENLKHKTRSGIRVRSKSELLITMVLSKYGIPYRYECALWVGDKYIYPDFTILHPVTGQVFYWEHFGRMDDEKYSQETFDKLRRYNANGIVPSINLITTYETEANPPDEEMIEMLVQHYFL